MSAAVHVGAWIVASPALFLHWPPAAALAAQATVAFVASRRLRLPPWWQAINGLFFPLAAAARGLDVNPAWYLGAFVLLALTSLGSLRHRVPLYLSSDAAVTAVAARLPRQPGLRVIDLGCGLGGWLRGMHAARPDLQLEGVELAPLNWLASRLRLGRGVEVRLGSLWDVDLSRYDVVYAYLSPAAMDRLWRKARAEMRPGTIFISNSFAVPGVEPDEAVELHDLSRARLLVWRL